MAAKTMTPRQITPWHSGVHTSVAPSFPLELFMVSAPLGDSDYQMIHAGVPYQTFCPPVTLQEFFLGSPWAHYHHDPLASRLQTLLLRHHDYSPPGEDIWTQTLAEGPTCPLLFLCHWAVSDQQLTSAHHALTLCKSFSIFPHQFYFAGNAICSKGFLRPGRPAPGVYWLRYVTMRST